MHQRKQLSIYRCLIFILAINIFSSCSEPGIDRAVEAEDLTVNLQRLDQAVFDAESPSPDVKHSDLLKEFPSFYSLYFEEVLMLGDPSDSLAAQHLSRFYTDKEWAFAQHQIDSVFSSSENMQELFSEGFGRYKTIFPNRNIPEVIIMNSGFNYGIYPIPHKNILAVGAEFYLGASNPMIKRLPNEMFPAYLRAQMNPEQLFPNAMKGWLLLNHIEPKAKKDLLGLMVTYGKVMYTLHLCIPNVPEWQHFAYTEEQLAWCKANEQYIWKVIVKEELLFSTDRKVLTDWVGRGPHSQGFAKESPAELAYFMGKEMVKDYMSSHPEMSVEEMNAIPANEILKSYSPN